MQFVFIFLAHVHFFLLRCRIILEIFAPDYFNHSDQLVHTPLHRFNSSEFGDGAHRIKVFNPAAELFDMLDVASRSINHDLISSDIGFFCFFIEEIDESGQVNIIWDGEVLLI